MCSFLISKRIFLVPIVVVVVAIQLVLVHSVSLNQSNEYLHHICSKSEGKFKPKSPYERNLNKLIHGIHEDTFKRGFVYSFLGAEPYTAYSLLQCRGEFYASKCGSCFTTAASELRKRCPMNKGGIIWFDKCLFKISPTDFYDKIDDKNKFYMSSKKNVSDPAWFNAKTKSLLIMMAGSKFTEKNFYQFGELELGGKKMTLYGMVQCTKDLDVTVCKKCLDEIIAELPECCDGKEGGRVLTGSCYFRYEIYPF